MVSTQAPGLARNYVPRFITISPSPKLKVIAVALSSLDEVHVEAGRSAAFDHLIMGQENGIRLMRFTRYAIDRRQAESRSASLTLC